MKKISFTLLIICLLLAPGLAGAAAQPGGNSPLVVRIFYDTPAQLQELADRLDVWAVQPQESRLTAQVSPAGLARLRSEGWRVTVDEAFTAQFNQAAASIQSGAADTAAAGIPGYACYRTVEETFTTLSTLETTYPALAQRIDIGDSWVKQNSAGVNGYDLWVLRLTNRARSGPKPRLFVMGEIHARELTSAETVLRFGEFLLQNYNIDPEVTWLLDHNEIYLLPMTNPDGRKKAENSIPWRKNLNSLNACAEPNAFGVDLNRNSSFHWGGSGSSPETCSDIYRGPSAASEPEVQAVQNYLASLYTDRRGPLDTDPAPTDAEGMLISLHSYGGLVLWPYAWTNTQAPNHFQLSALGGKLAYLNNYLPKQASSLYAASGGTDDWAYGVLGLASYTIEMGTQFFEPCADFESTVWPANRAALLYAAKAVRRPYAAPAGPEVVSPQVSPACVTAGQPLTLTAALSGERSKTAPPLNLQAARYTLDTPAWAGAAAVSLPAADGAFNSPAENIAAAINTSGLAASRHTLFVETQGQNNTWGVPAAVFFHVSAPPSPARGLPGEWISYSLTICNSGTAPETYTLSAASTWETNLPANPLGPVAAGAGVSFTVKVRIPPGTPGGASLTTQVSWAPQNKPAEVTSTSLTTTVNWQTWLANVRK